MKISGSYSLHSFDTDHECDELTDGRTDASAMTKTRGALHAAARKNAPNSFSAIIHFPQRLQTAPDVPCTRRRLGAVHGFSDFADDPVPDLDLRVLGLNFCFKAPEYARIANIKSRWRLEIFGRFYSSKMLRVYTF